MGRIGDGDVHAAYVEFRAKESDKVSSFESILFPVPTPLAVLEVRGERDEIQEEDQQHRHLASLPPTDPGPKNISLISHF